MSYPRAAEAAVRRETVVDAEALVNRNRHKCFLCAKLKEVFVVLDAGETVLLGHLVLVHEDVVASAESRRHREAAVAAVETGKNLGGRCNLLNRRELRVDRVLANNADDRDEGLRPGIPGGLKRFGGVAAVSFGYGEGRESTLPLGVSELW